MFISLDRGSKTMSLVIFRILVGIMQGPTLLLESNEHIKSLVLSAALVRPVVKLVVQVRCSQVICQSFLSRREIFWRFFPFEVKQLLKFSAISVGAVMVLPSTIRFDILLSFLLFREDRFFLIFLKIFLIASLFAYSY